MSVKFLDKQCRIVFYSVFFCCTFFATSSLKATDTISLAGKWAFQADPKDVGLAQNWANKKLTGSIILPGSTDEIKVGNQYVSS